MMNQTDSQLDSVSEEKPLSLDQQQQQEINNAVDSHASSSGDVSKGPNVANNLVAPSDAEMVNQTDSQLDSIQTDSQLDSINEEKPLSLDQQQQLEMKNAVDSDASSSEDVSKGPNVANNLVDRSDAETMNQTDSQLDSINEEKPLSLDQQQQLEMKNAVDSHASSSAQSDAEMMNQTDSQLDSINEEKPLSLDQQQQLEMSNISLPPLRNYPREPNLPNMDLLRGPREEYLKIGVPLYKASAKGDWEAAKAILDERPYLARYSITENGETALHVAASTKSSKEVENFVTNLVNLMTKEDLELQNRNYNTALYLAAVGGNIKTVKTMAEKNRALHAIPGGRAGFGPVRAEQLHRAQNP